jgi:hypothetical protein
VRRYTKGEEASERGLETSQQQERNRERTKRTRRAFSASHFFSFLLRCIWPLQLSMPQKKKNTEDDLDDLLLGLTKKTSSKKRVCSLSPFFFFSLCVIFFFFSLLFLTKLAENQKEG